MQNHFLSLIKLKNTESAQLWPLTHLNCNYLVGLFNEHVGPCCDALAFLANVGHDLAGEPANTEHIEHWGGGGVVFPLPAELGTFGIF